MTRSGLGFAVCSIVGLAAAASIAQDRVIPNFRFERPVVVPGSGPHRLPIDVPLLVGANPFRVSIAPSVASSGERELISSATDGVTDFRLYDGSGKDVPYLLVSNPPIEPTWHPASAILAVAPVETDRVKSSGFEADFGKLLVVDRVRFDALSPPYLKRVRIEGSGDRTRWTVLIPEGTVFDLPDSQLRQTSLSFEAGSYRYVRVTWDDTRSARIVQTPAFAAREVSVAAPRAPLTTPVSFERRPSEPGRSRLHLRLPGGRLPIVALVIDVAGGRVLRDVEIFEARLTRAEAEPTVIGRATLKRIEQGALAASALRVPIEAPVEADLDLVINDGDNQPLEVRGISAEFAELPWIYFEAPEGGLVARYGNGSLLAPHYDLEAARPSLHVETVADATWGQPRARTTTENTDSATAPLPTVGAAIDAGAFRFVRDIPPGDAGLVAVRLDAAALAHSRGVGARFADVRVIDVQSRQIPYLLERVSEPLSIDLTPVKLSARPAVLGDSGAAETIYRVDWPYADLPSPRLVLTTSARVFKRAIRVVAERDADRRRRDPWADTIASATWVHSDQDRGAPSLVMPLAHTLTKSVLLVVEEGDNAALPIASARLLLPAYRMRLFRDTGQVLRLAYGHRELNPPNYDLALLASRVFGVSAAEVSPAPESDERSASATGISPRVFWAILALAVMVLLGLIARLLGKPTT